MRLSLRLILLLGIAATLSACGSSRKMQRYDYLTRETNRTTTTPTQPNPEVSERPEREIESAPTPENPSAFSSAGTLSPNEVETIVETAMSYQGTPYKYGGMSRSGMDCSGLVYTSFQAAERSVPRTSSSLASQGKRVSLNNARPGHLVLFSAKGSGRVDHVGLVVAGEGEDLSFIHATTSRGVRVDKLDSYWKPRLQKTVSF